MSEARMPYSAPEAMPIRWSIQEHQDGRWTMLAPGERLELVNDSDRERRVIVPAAGIGPEAEAEVDGLRAEVERLRAENATLRAGPTIRAPGREELYRREADRLRRERDDLLLAVRAACQQALDSPEDTDALLSALEGVFEAVKGIAGPDATTPLGREMVAGAEAYCDRVEVDKLRAEVERLAREREALRLSLKTLVDLKAMKDSGKVESMAMHDRMKGMAWETARVVLASLAAGPDATTEETNQ